jgi:uncharacterized ferritin-like protein (DUF455 family)
LTVASLATILHQPDAGHDASAGRVIVVQAVRGERAQLEERRSGIEQPVDAVAHRELAAVAVALDRGVITARSPIGEL